MLGAAVAIFLWLLPLQVNGLITTDAKCLSGFEWTFSSIGQSPCDVAAELATVCVGSQFNLLPLSTGLLYGGPTKANQNDCRCSSVYYSLLSACSYCQGQVYLEWPVYSTNCTTPHLAVYTEQIPVGVKVPAYAYQDVSVSKSFDVILAQSMKGVESTRLPQPSSTTTSGSTLGAAPAQTSSSTSRTTNNTPAIIGGVVGGVVAIGLIAALIIFLMLRSKQKTQKYNSSFQLTSPSIIQSPPPGSPGRTYNPYDDDKGLDPNINDPNRPLSQNVASNITGSSGQNHKTSHYSGMPEI